MIEQMVELPQGRVAYVDEGEGPTILMSHGIFVDASLWDGLAKRLVAAGFRCIRPQAPLGAHRIPLNPEADISPPGVANLLADLIRELDLGPVAVVGNDSGGAIAQMLAAGHPELVSSLVLTNCDALEVYPPFPFTLLPLVARIPGGIAALSSILRLKPLRWATYRPLTERPLPDRQLKAWLEPAWSDPGIRRDITRMLKGVEGDQTMKAAEALRSYDKPVLMPWGVKDRFFRIGLAHRLAAFLPNARVAPIEGGRTFIPVDRPDEVSRLMVEFLS